MENNLVKQNMYLVKVQMALTDLNNAFQTLDQFWGTNSKHGVDLNDYLATMYPFAISFDDLTQEVKLWVNDSSERINRVLEENSEEDSTLEEEVP